MANDLQRLREGLFERAGISHGVSYIAYRAGRIRLAIVIASLPALALAILALVSESVAATVMDERIVRDFFVRAFSAVVTASAIAVSVATFTFGRELRDLRTLREHYEENLAHRAKLRTAHGGEVPLVMADLILISLATISESARRVREEASACAVTSRSEGVTLEDYLRHVLDATERTERDLPMVRRDLSELNLVVADFDHDVADHFAGVFMRDEDLPSAVRDALGILRDRLKAYTLTAQYTKTLVYQWGLSRMSIALLLSVVPSVSVAAFMVLAYPADFASVFGAGVTISLVSLAAAAVLVPIALFLSYVLRFVIFNQLTLPTAGFVLVSRSD